MLQTSAAGSAAGIRPMKENDPAGKDEGLSKLLHSCKTEASLPPRFQEAVWQRLERADAGVPAPLWHRVIARLEAAFSRPALVVSYVGVLLFTGLGAGYWHAEGKNTHAASEWRARYVQTVDPYQMPR